MRAVFLTGFQSLMVVSNCIPGSPHWCVASAMSCRISLACQRSLGCLLRTERVHQSSSFSAARMKSSVTRTELFAFWNEIVE